MKKKAGAFLAKGADTCVYAPPVKCTAESGPDLSGDNTKVSRIVGNNDPEIATQERLKAILATISPFVQKYFMTYDTKCVPDFRLQDTTDFCATTQVAIREEAEGPRPGMANLITKKFKGDYSRLQDSPRNRAIALRDLAAATLYLFDPQGNTVLHMDTHAGNIAFVEEQGSYYLTLNDWGRSLVVNVNAPDVHGQLQAEAARNPIYRGDIDTYITTANTNSKYWLRYITRAWQHMIQTNNPRWNGFCVCMNVLGILGTWAASFPEHLNDIDAAYVFIGTQFTSGSSTINELKRRVIRRLNQIPLPANPAAPPPAAVYVSNTGFNPGMFVPAPPAAPVPADAVAINVNPGGRRKTRRRKTTRGLRPRSGGRARRRPARRSRASSARSPPSAS